MKYDILVFFKNLSRKFKFHCNVTRITGTLHEDQMHFLTFLAQFFSELVMFQARVVEKIKAHILLSITFFFENHSVLEIMWKYIVEWGRPQMTIWRMRIACWVFKATNTHLLYVILIAFPLQQWLHESTSLLGYTYIACLVLKFSPKFY
jgi:hypothetical protein